MLFNQNTRERKFALRKLPKSPFLFLLFAISYDEWILNIKSPITYLLSQGKLTSWLNSEESKLPASWSVKVKGRGHSSSFAKMYFFVLHVGFPCIHLHREQTSHKVIFMISTTAQMGNILHYPASTCIVKKVIEFLTSLNLIQTWKLRYSFD